MSQHNGELICKGSGVFEICNRLLYTGFAISSGCDSHRTLIHISNRNKAQTSGPRHSNMPTQRSYLGSFLAAFRAHSQPLSKPSTSISSPANTTSTSSIWTAANKTGQTSSTVSEHAVTSPRPINVKTSPYGASAAATTSDKSLHTSLPPLQHNVSPQTHLARSPPATAANVYGPTNKPTTNYPTCQEVHRSGRRRGSDSSIDSSGFRERGTSAEKYFIGGRTAGGEERYYKLSMIKRERSADRISADQLSL